jgi:methylmalonyl-CoA mutase, N-terminal domain
VNAFTEGNDDSDMAILRITNEDEARQRKRLDKVRQDRDQAAVDAALAKLPPRPPTRRST